MNWWKLFRLAICPVTGFAFALGIVYIARHYGPWPKVKHEMPALVAAPAERTDVRNFSPVVTFYEDNRSLTAQGTNCRVEPDDDKSNVIVDCKEFSIFIFGPEHK